MESGGGSDIPRNIKTSIEFALRGEHKLASNELISEKISKLFSPKLLGGQVIFNRAKLIP